MANTKITTNVIADGAITSAKLDTNITISGNITGTLATAAQPNITSLGTLTGLNVAGTTATVNITGGSTGASLINFGDSDDGNVGRIYYDHSANFMQFKAADGERLRINSTGIDVTGSIEADDYRAVGTGTFYATANTFIKRHSTGSEHFRITDAGLVGIGTSSPSTKLHINGGRSTFYSQDNYAVGVGNAAGQLGGYIGSPSVNVMSFSEPGGVERMRIDASGAVIVNNSGGDAQIYLGGNSGTSRMYLARSGTDALLWNASSGNLRFGNNNAERFRISSTSAGVTQADGDYLARMYESGADGYLALYTGEASPVEQTRVSSYGQSFVNKDTVGQTSTNKTILSVGTDEQSASGTFHVSDGDAANGGIRQSTHSSRVYTNVSSVYTQVSNNRYWHIKTNIQSPNNIMYIVRVHGYSYGNAGHIIDLQRSGYAYSSHGLHTNTQIANNGSSTSHTLVHYFASDNYLCFRCDSGGGYFTGLGMDIKFQSPTGYNWNYRTIEHQINSDSGSYY